MYMFVLFKGVVQDYNKAGFTRLFFEAELEAESKLKSSAQKISAESASESMFTWLFLQRRNRVQFRVENSRVNPA